MEALLRVKQQGQLQPAAHRQPEQQQKLPIREFPIRGTRLRRLRQIREQLRASREHPHRPKTPRKKGRHPQGRLWGGVECSRRLLPVEHPDIRGARTTRQHLRTSQQPERLVSREPLATPLRRLRQKPSRRTVGKAARKKPQPSVRILQSPTALSRQRTEKTPERPRAPAILPAQHQQERQPQALQALRAVQLPLKAARQAISLPIRKMGLASIRPLPGFPVCPVLPARQGVQRRQATADRSVQHLNRQGQRFLPHRHRIRLPLLPVFP